LRPRSRRAESQPGGARLLLGLYADLYPRLVGAGGRARTGRPGWRGPAPRSGDGGRPPPLPPRPPDPLPSGPRGESVGQRVGSWFASCSLSFSPDGRRIHRTDSQADTRNAPLLGGGEAAHALDPALRRLRAALLLPAAALPALSVAQRGVGAGERP